MTTINNATLMSNTVNSSAAGVSAAKDSYLDQNALNSVKAMGRKNDPQALKEISKKFEGMFVQQMLKSMRDANEVFAEGDELSSHEVKFHQDMLDQQMVLNLTSGKGIGLASSMYQQMLKSYGVPSSQPAAVNPVGINSASATNTQLPKSMQSVIPSVGSARPAKPKVDEKSKTSVLQDAEEFIKKLKPYAEKAAEALHVKVDVLLAQAALETGWGKSLIKDKNGNSSFNVFNIKSTGEWQGKSVSVNSVEFKNGAMQPEMSDFRHYDDLFHSFNDYVNLIKNNPRYEKALAAGDNSHQYAEALQQAGYATDPHYAQKIKQLLSSDIIRSASQPDQLANINTETRKG